MRHLVFAVCLSSVPALAATKTVEGPGYKLESTSPALPNLKFKGPEGSELSLSDKPGSQVSRGYCKLPCDRTPHGDWTQVVFTVEIKGAQWATGIIKLEPRTAYVVTVDDPNGLPASGSTSAPAQAPARPAPSTPAAPPPSAPAPGKSAGMDAAQFQKLRTAVEKESMTSSKMSVLKMGVRNARLTVAQVGTLVDLFTFGGDKVNVVRLTRAGIVDPNNAADLMKHFTYGAEKEQVQALFEGDDADSDTSPARGRPSRPEAPSMPEGMDIE